MQIWNFIPPHVIAIVWNAKARRIIQLTKLMNGPIKINIFINAVANYAICSVAT